MQVTETGLGEPQLVQYQGPTTIRFAAASARRLEFSIVLVAHLQPRHPSGEPLKGRGKRQKLLAAAEIKPDLGGKLAQLLSSFPVYLDAVFFLR